MAVPKYPFPIVGGQERQAHELAKALVRGGHQVCVVSCRFDPGQGRVESIDGAQVFRVRWIEYKPARFLLSPFSLARHLYRLRHEVDLVHVHNISWFGAFVTLFAKLLGIPVLTKLPNTGKSGIPGMLRRPFGDLRVALLKHADAIVALNPENVAELSHIDYPSGQVLKVSNGIPLLLDSPLAQSSSGEVSAVFVGRLIPGKGLLDLIHAWAVVKVRSSRPVRLRLIGDGPQADELRALVLALNLGESVELSGYCADVPAKLAQADLFVLPSYREGNSNAILEAMRAGLPIVATSVGGAANQVGREGEGFLVPPGDRQALADRLLALIEDETMRHRLGRSMRQRIEGMFDIAAIATVYEQAYELILSGRRGQIGQLNATWSNRITTEN